MKLWLNGAITDADIPAIDPADRGFLLGDGIFETMLVLNGRIAFCEEHMMRLANGASVIHIRLPFAPHEIEAACYELLSTNALTKAPRASLRVTLTRGPAPRGLTLPTEPRPTLLITCAAGGQPPSALSAIITSARRNPWSPTANLKALPYLDNVLAKEEARLKGADEALMLETAGHVACASAANIFIWEGDKLLTPPEDCGILPGITRVALLELAPDLGIEASEERFTPQQLHESQGAFITNSLMGIVPLSRVGEHIIPTHRLTGRLVAAYDALLDVATR